MVVVEKMGLLLSPTHHEFENNGVFNPGVMQEGEQVHLFYRAVQEGNYSTIGYARSEGPFSIQERRDIPIIGRTLDYEAHGVEDPRIVKIENIYYLTYSAYDGINVMGALATSSDLQHFEKQGIITPIVNYNEYRDLIENCCHELNPKYMEYLHLFAELGVVPDEFRILRDKDVVLFPRKINNHFVLLHRIWPGIQIVYFKTWEELTPDFWRDYLSNLNKYVLLDPHDPFEVNYIGAGCPPIETSFGWILIYHGVQETIYGKTYHARVSLLKLDQPGHELARLEYPLFSPTLTWEKEGVVPDVVFPTGVAQFDDYLFIYYGAADKHIAVAKVNINELLSELLKNKN